MALFWVLHLGVFRSAQVAPVGILLISKALRYLLKCIKTNDLLHKISLLYKSCCNPNENQDT